MGCQVYADKCSEKICYTKGSWLAVWMCAPFAEERASKRMPYDEPWYDDGVLAVEVKMAHECTPVSYAAWLDSPHGDPSATREDFEVARAFVRDCALAESGFRVSY